MRGRFEIRIFLLLSGYACLGLSMLENIVSFIVNMSLAIVLTVYFLGGSTIIENKAIRYERKSIIYLVAIMVTSLGGASFYGTWHSSNRVLRLAEILGIREQYLIGILSIVLSVMGIPFVIWFIYRLCIWTVSEDENNVSSLTVNKIYPYTYWVIYIIGIVSQIIFAFSSDIWVDEAFSIAMIKHSYRQIIAYTAADVHPPLYYIILKSIVDFLQMFTDKISIIHIAKLISIIPYGIIGIILMTLGKNIWGKYAAAIGAVCLVGMPNLCAYGVEIRMYSWGSLFVFLAYLQCCRIMEKSTINSWMCFVLACLAAAYTHYFAAVSVGCLHIALLIYLVLSKKKEIGIWVSATIIAIICYLPWIRILWEQVSSVSDNYWIEKIKFPTMATYIMYALGNLIMLLMVGIILYKMKKGNSFKWGENVRLFQAMTGIFVPSGTVLIGILASIVIRPVFVSRYMIMGLLCLWIGLGIGVELIREKTIRTSFSMIVLIMSITTIASFSVKEYCLLKEGEKISEFVTEKSGGVYITDNILVQRVMTEISNDMCYIWKDEQTSDIASSVAYAVYGKNRIKAVDSEEEVKQMLKEGRKVYWLIGKGEEKKIPITSQYVGTYRVGSKVDIYEIREE